MERDFTSKVLRPGDAGYQYDKRIDFASPKHDEGDASWDEGDGDDEDYFDDDFA